MPAVGGYLIYTLLGYWIDNYELSKKWRCVIYAAALGGFLLMLVGTQILSLKNGTVDTTLRSIGMFRVFCTLPEYFCFLRI